MKLTPEEIERYRRHLVLRDVGGQGQQKLKASRVLVVGAGGLGSPVIMYLAAAGVGTLGIIDDDLVTLSNLQRQIVHDTGQVGRPKVESARRTVADLNPHVRVERYAERLDAANALDIIGRYDIVADGSDNFATRYLVSRCLLSGAQAAGVRGGRALRRLCDDVQAARAASRRRAVAHLPLPVSRVASSGHRGQLRRGGRARRRCRRGRRSAGDGGVEGDCRHRRKSGRPPSHLRCARPALRAGEDGLGPRQPAVGPAGDHYGPVDPCRAVRGGVLASDTAS